MANQNKRNGTRSGIVIKCELCDVACTGRDAYGAHVRGMKHQKTIKLHQKLGKPIPPDVNFSQLPAAAASSNTLATNNGSSVISAPPSLNLNKSTTNINTNTISNSTPPKINFVGIGSNLKTITNENTASIEVIKKANIDTIIEHNENVMRVKSPVGVDNPVDDGDYSHLEPIGREYIETRIEGKILSFYCKLCDCQFNDPNAKDMHTKGRRHRLAYKKKVDPSLKVDMKGSSTRVSKTSSQLKQGRVLKSRGDKFLLKESSSSSSQSIPGTNTILENNLINEGNGNGIGIKPLMSATLGDTIINQSNSLQELMSQQAK